MELYQNRDPVRRQNRTAKPENPNKTQHTGPTASRDRCFTVAVVCVFLLCFVLLIATTVLWIKYSIQTADKEELQTRHDAFIIDRDQLLSRYKLLQISYGKMILERDSLMERNENLMINKEELQNSTAELQRKLRDFDDLKKQLALIDQYTNLGWGYFNFTFYYISATWKDWEASRNACRALSPTADLVIINSKNEHDFILNLLPHDYEGWIGLNNINNEREWKWVDGTSLTNPYWDVAQPNRTHVNNTCVEIVGWQKKWKNRLCSTGLWGICEMKVF